MKRFISILLCGGLLLSQLAYAGDKETPEAEVNSRVAALSDAMVKADGDALKKLTSLALSYGHSSGRVENQAEFVENILNGNSNFLSIELLDQNISIVDDIAIVRHILSGNTHDKGKEPGTVRIGVMLVWKKIQGDWVLLARQAYRLPQ